MPVSTVVAKCGCSRFSCDMQLELIRTRTNEVKANATHPRVELRNSVDPLLELVIK